MRVGRRTIVGLATLVAPMLLMGCGQPTKSIPKTKVSIPAFPKEGIRDEKLQLSRDGMSSDNYDPLVLVHATNALYPLGFEKAIRYLKSYAVTAQAEQADQWLYLLVRVLFVGKKPGYVFPKSHMGYVEPAPEVFAAWPSYPVWPIGDVPIMVNPGSSTGGIYAPLSFYLDENSKDWKLRDKPLILPDDPFPLYQKILKSGIVDPKRAQDRTQVASEIFRLVRTAYCLKDSYWVTQISIDDPRFEAAHQEFLALGCHWDPNLNLYVRKDGSFDKDEGKFNPNPVYHP
ncbi:MAG: hypothetical protein WCG75_09875 [Armatimonadota bacterium]